MLLTAKYLTLIGREKSKNKADKGQLIEVIKRSVPLLVGIDCSVVVLIESFCRQIDIAHILSIGISPYQDDFVIVNVRENYTSLLETPFKTEFITALRFGGLSSVLVANVAY